MKSIYLSGYSVAHAERLAGMGLLTMPEVAKTASMVASAVDVPIIADADDGYGNALSTMRTVQEFVKTGVAGSPRGPALSPSDAATLPARRWCLAKRPSASTRPRSRSGPAGPGLVVIGAHRRLRGGRREHGGRVWRGRAYADAGVDLVWAELSNSERGPAIEFARAMRQTHPKLPLAFNYSSSFRWHKDPTR